MNAPTLPAVASGFTPETLALMKALQPPPKKNEKTGTYIMAGILFVGAAGLGYWYWKKKQDEKKKNGGKNSDSSWF